MKNIFKYILLALTVVLFASCDQDYWNEDNFEKSEYEYTPTDVQVVDYTLTASDYSAVASNATNKNLAGDALSNALKAVGSKGYFSDDITAKDYLPAFMSTSSFKYFTLDAGADVKVTYNKLAELPANYDKVDEAQSYTISEDEYVTAWKSKENYVEYYTPTVSPAKNIAKALKSGISGAASGDYAVVSYKYSQNEPVFGSVDDDPAYTGPKFEKVSEFTGDGVYMMIATSEDSNYAVTPLAATKNYGYPGATAVDVVDGTYVVSEKDIYDMGFVFKATTSGNYTIQDKITGRYYYVSGTYNSVNLSATAAEVGGEFSITANGDGTFKVLNVDKSKWLQFDATYTSYGFYNTDKTCMVQLYKLIPVYEKATSFEAGTYIMAANNADANYAVTALAATKNYGYPGATSIEVKDGAIDAASVTDDLRFSFVAATSGNYTIQDNSTYRYYYMSGTYNSVNLSATAAEAGGEFSVTANGDGTFKVMNVEKAKWLQFDATYTSYGFYNTNKTCMVNLYKEVCYNAAPSLTKAALNPSTADTKYDIYTYDGSAWVEAEDAVVVNPSDYESMGVGSYLSSADNYLPAFLAQKFPYAQEGDEMMVVYQSSSSAKSVAYFHFVDGAWSNATVETVTEKFSHSEKGWVYNPSVYVTLNPNYKGDNATFVKAFYQSIVTWVGTNKDTKYYQKSSSGYYTNADYYFGATAYRLYFAFNPTLWKSDSYGASDDYKSMSDLDLRKLQYVRLKEALVHGLEASYSDLAPVAGAEITATAKFAIFYDSPLANIKDESGNYEVYTHEIVYTVVGKGQFEFKSINDLRSDDEKKAEADALGISESELAKIMSATAL